MTPRINTSQLQDLAFLRPKQKAISLHIPFLWIIRCRVDAARPITGKLIGLRFVLLYTNEYTSRHTYCLILFITQTLNQKRRIKNGCYDRANPQTHKHTYLHKLGFITIKDKHQQTGKLKQNIIEHASNGALVDICLTTWYTGFFSFFCCSFMRLSYCEKGLLYVPVKLIISEKCNYRNHTAHIPTRRTPPEERQTATKQLAKIAFFCSAYFRMLRKK